MIGLGEEEPALGDQADILHHEGGEQQTDGGRGQAHGQQRHRHREHQHQEDPLDALHEGRGLVVEELAGVEGAGHEALRLLLDVAVAHADGGLQGGLVLDPGVADQRGAAGDQRGHGQDDGPGAVEFQQAGRLVPGGVGGGQGEAGGAAQQGVVDHGQRRGPFLQELDAGVDHAGGNEQAEGEHGGDRAHDHGQVDGDIGLLADLEEHRVPAGVVNQAVEEHQAHEGGQDDDLARQPGGAPLGDGAPAALRVAQVEEGGQQTGTQEQQGDQAADAVEGGGILVPRQHLGHGIDLAGVQCQEQPLADAAQGGEEDDGKCGMHVFRSDL